MRYSCFVFVLYLVTMVTMLTVASGDVFSSTAHVTSMFGFEKKLLDRLEDYLRISKKRLDVIKQLSTDFNDIWEEAMNKSTGSEPSVADAVDSGHVTGINSEESGESKIDSNNPEARKPDRWAQIEAIIQWDPFNDVLEDMHEQWLGYVPSEESLVGVHQSMVRLTQLYHLDPHHMAARGAIRGNMAATSLSAEDLRNMAIVALNDGKFGICEQLLDAAVRLRGGKTWLTSVNHLRAVAAYGLRETTQPQAVYDDENEDDGLDDVITTDLDLVLSWKHPDGDAELSWTEEFETYDPEEGFQIPERAYGARFNIYEDLCRGQHVYSHSSLYCEIRYGSLPYYHWWRMEHLHLQPEVTLIYNMTTDAQSERIKDAIKDKMMRASVNTAELGQDQISRQRLGKNAWLYPWELEKLARGLDKRLTEITGLDCERWAEDLQVAVYGIGGMYEPHYDYDQKIFKYNPTQGIHMGDRLATAMLYLSDVEAGGATVFPLLRVAAFPVKNAAIFWHNIDEDGEPRADSLHGGCPVLLGHKWVANKWIHEYGQEFRRPCALTRSSMEADELYDEDELSEDEE